MDETIHIVAATKAASLYQARFAFDLAKSTPEKPHVFTEEIQAQRLMGNYRFFLDQLATVAV